MLLFLVSNQQIRLFLLTNLDWSSNRTTSPIQFCSVSCSALVLFLKFIFACGFPLLSWLNTTSMASSSEMSVNLPEKSSFSQTCSLLSQYLKEGGSFGDLSLGISSNIEANGKVFNYIICLAAEKVKKKFKFILVSIYMFFWVAFLFGRKTNYAFSSLSSNTDYLDA